MKIQKERLRLTACLACLLVGCSTLAEANVTPWTETIEKSIDLQDAGKYVEAERALLDAMEQTKDFESGDLRRAVTLSNLAAVSQALGKYLEAEQYLSRAIHIWGQTAGEEGPGWVQLNSILVGLYTAQGQYARADHIVRDKLTSRVEALRSENAQVAQFYHRVGSLRVAQHKYEEAEDYYLRALDICRRVQGPEHPMVAMILNDLAVLDVTLSRLTQAETRLQKAAAIWENATDPQHPGLARMLLNLGGVYDEMGVPETAEPVLKRALTIAEGRLGEEHVIVAEVLSVYAPVLRELDRKGEAKEAEKRAKQIFQRHAKENLLYHTLDVTGILGEQEGGETGSP